MRKLLATIAATTLILAACGGDDGGGGGGGSPEETLTQAVEALSEGGRTLTFSLNSDAASLSALSEGTLSEEDAGKILDSSLSFSTNGADDPAEAEFAMAANVAGSTDVEIRFVGEVLYLRIDLDSLLDLAGPEAKSAAQAQISALVQQASAQGLDWVEPAVNGEWLAFTGITELLEQFGGLQASPTAEQQAIIDQFATALTDSATVTSEGDEDPGEHLVASIELKDLVANFSELFAELGTPVSDFPSESEIPEGEISLDVWVADGQLTQVEFDFLQLAELELPESEEIPEGVESLGLRVTLEEFSGGVETPSGATEVNLTELIQTFMGGGIPGGGAPPGGGADAFCEQLKAQPKSVQKQFAAQCPDL